MEVQRKLHTSTPPHLHTSIPPYRRFAAILFYSLVLLLLALLTQRLWDAAQDRWRGVVRGVPAQTRQIETAPWGTTVALEQYDDAELERTLDRLDALGVVWLRQELRWADIEPRRGDFEWAQWDRVLRAAHARDFHLILVLNTSPAWARAENPQERLAPPNDTADFARFADVTSRRYADAADAYQIWDQPNLRPHWGDAFVDPAGYAALLHAGAEPIRRNDPDALVVTAGLAPNGEAGGFNMSEQRFLQGLYDAGAVDDFDVVAYKAFGFWTGPGDRRYDETILNWSRAALLREVMVRAGDTETPVWFTEGGWASLPDGWTGQPPPWGSDRPEVQTERLRNAVARTRLEWPWVGLLALHVYQPVVPEDDPRWGLALARPNGKLTPLGLAWQQITADGEVLTPGWWPTDAWPLDDVGAGEVVRVRGSRVLVQATREAHLQELTHEFDSDGVTEITLPNDRPATVVVTYNPPAWWRWWLAVVLSAATTAVVGLRWSWLTWHLPWSAWRDRYRALPEPTQIGIFALYLVLFFVAPGHPVLGTLLYLGLGVLVWARLDLGLAAIPATLPFFLWGKSFGALRFSLPELLTVLCAIRWLVSFDARRKTKDEADVRIDVLRLTSSVFEKLRPRDLLDWSVVALVALAAVSVFWAQIFGVAAREFRVVVLEPAIFYWLIRRAGLDRTQLRRLVDALLLGGVLVSLHALWQLVGGGAIAAEGVLRVTGPYGSPNNLSLYLGRLVPLALVVGIWDLGFGIWDLGFTIRKTQYAIRNIFHVAALMLIGAALFFTFSRGALLLGLPVALLYVAVISGSRRVRIVALAAIVAGVLALVPFAQTERVRSLFDPTTGTLHLRVLLWRASIDMVRDFTILGVGLDNFLYVYPDYRYAAAWREPNLNHPHNVLLHFWLALGLGGVLVFLWQQAAFWRTAWRLRDRLTHAFDRALLAGATAVMVYTLAHGLIDNSFFLVDLAFVWMLVLGLVGRLLSGEP